uniref:B-cell receptor CD22-like n=1 Tax=Poecilia latipinna TaxID=48699 RepID=A0A3B3TUP8_9TELE
TDIVQNNLISPIQATVVLNPNWPLIYKGERVYLQCRIPGGKGTKWTYEWRPTRLNEPVTSNKYINLLPANESHSGEYSCRGTNGSDSTAWSDAVVLTVVMTLHPNWPQMFSGETISLTCEVHGGETTEWTYEWRRDGSFIHMTHEKNLTFSVSESNSGDYRCLSLLKDGGFSSTEWSEPISVSVSGKPKAHLSTDSTELPVGGNVTLTCSLNTSSSSSFSWKYFWYRGEKSSEPLTREWTDGQVSVSEEGLYWCRGGRGEPVYYTDYSDPIHISKLFYGPVGSSLFVLLVVALLGGISLVILLLLFWRSRQMKGERDVFSGSGSSSKVF